MNDAIQFLFDDGSFVEAVDDGYVVNWPLFRALHPTLAEDMWNDHMAEVEEAMSALVDKGFLQMIFTTDDDGSIHAAYELTLLGRMMADMESE